jgi:hypothetical protein
MAELNLKRDLAMLEYASANKLKLDDVKKELAINTMKIRSVERLAAHGASAAQMPKPPIEPRGRAEPGKSFQQ